MDKQLGLAWQEDARKVDIVGSQRNVGPGQADGGRSPQKRLNQGSYFVKSASREPLGRSRMALNVGQLRPQAE